MKNKKQIIISLIIAIIILPIISYSLRYIDIKNETEELTTLDSILHIIIMGIIIAGVAALSYNIISFYKDLGKYFERPRIEIENDHSSFEQMYGKRSDKEVQDLINNTQFYGRSEDEKEAQILKEKFENKSK